MISSFVASLSILAAAGPAQAPVSPGRWILQNERVRCEFDGAGLTALKDLKGPLVLSIADRGAILSLSGERMATEKWAPVAVESTPTKLVYRYKPSSGDLDLVFELKPGRRFLSKKVIYRRRDAAPFTVQEASPLNLQVKQPDDLRVSGSLNASAWFLKTAPGRSRKQGLFALLQNPFAVFKAEAGDLSMDYRPEMEWRASYGAFETDWVCLGITDLTGDPIATSMVDEWRFAPDVVLKTVDSGEWSAVRDCAREFLRYKPQKAAKIHIPWCENDYQIDVAKPEGVAEYRRIIDRAAELGCDYVLYTPANSDLAPVKDNTDAWGWEDMLWLGLGQKMRKGEWNPETDAVPESVQGALDYARSKNVRLMAYVYPSLGWTQKPEWTAWAKGKTGGYVGADTGIRSFQDFLVDRIVSFCGKTGVAGVSFDHWWIAYDGATSKYAQWYGCRRVMEQLREKMPGIVIDGRQQYQHFGVWTWLAGSYPHPTSTDEQPESFKSIPDLHTDRVSAARQRYTAYRYAVPMGAPPELVPGFITHQSERNGEKGFSRTPARTRDWDVTSWRYSLLSTVATAPFAMVVNMIPARDPDEFKAMSEEDKKWFRFWMAWPDKHLAYIRNTRPILGPPALGKVDGTSMIVGDGGFVFLFNPNYRQLTAKFKLDQTIGLEKGANYAVKRVYPEGNPLIGSRNGLWSRGDEVSVPLNGGSAVVLQISPSAGFGPFAVLGLPGVAVPAGEVLKITGVSGERGSFQDIAVVTPKGRKFGKCTANGKEVVFKQEGDLVTAQVRFNDISFVVAEPLGTYDPKFAGGTIAYEVIIPGWVSEQLKTRPQRWPVPYTADDLRATWLGTDRLLLYVQIADPKDDMAVQVKVDGEPVEVKKAYNSIYGNAPEQTFLGFYIDVSDLDADYRHGIEVTLPKLAPGQFQGVFFENLEPSFTKQILGKGEGRKRTRADKLKERDIYDRIKKKKQQ